MAVAVPPGDAGNTSLTAALLGSFQENQRFGLMDIQNPAGLGLRGYDLRCWTSGVPTAAAADPNQDQPGNDQAGCGRLGQQLPAVEVFTQPVRPHLCQQERPQK